MPGIQPEAVSPNRRTCPSCVISVQNSGASNLAWLDIDEQGGIEYWMEMILAGDYVSACHHVIHDKIAKQSGRRPLKIV